MDLWAPSVIPSLCSVDYKHIYHVLFLAQSLLIKSLFPVYSLQVTLSNLLKSLFPIYSRYSFQLTLFKSLFPVFSLQVTLFNMLSSIVAGSILALSVGKALAAVQFGGVNIAGYVLLYLDCYYDRVC